MRNIYIHTGIRWEHREYFDVSNMTAFNTYRGDKEDEVYVSMMQDFTFELPDMTEYYYVYDSEPYYVNEDDYAKAFRKAYAIVGKSTFDRFFATVGFYPSKDNLTKARDYFDKQK